MKLAAKNTVKDTSAPVSSQCVSLGPQRWSLLYLNPIAPLPQGVLVAPEVEAVVPVTKAGTLVPPSHRVFFLPLRWMEAVVPETKAGTLVPPSHKVFFLPLRWKLLCLRHRQGPWCHPQTRCSCCPWGGSCCTWDKGRNPGAPLPQGVLVAPEGKVVPTVERLPTIVAGKDYVALHHM